MAGFWIKIWGEHTVGVWIGGTVKIGDGKASESAAEPRPASNIFDGLTFATPSDAAAFSRLPESDQIALRRWLVVRGQAASSFDSTNQRWIANKAGAFERLPPFSEVTQTFAFKTIYDREAFENLSSDDERQKILDLVGQNADAEDENGLVWSWVGANPHKFAIVGKSDNRTVGLMEFETEADAAEARKLSKEERQALRFELLKNGQFVPSRDALGREWIEKPSGRYALVQGEKGPELDPPGNALVVEEG